MLWVQLSGMKCGLGLGKGVDADMPKGPEIEEI